MLVLCHVAARVVVQRWICFDYAAVDELLQGHEVLGERLVQPSSAESERAEPFSDLGRARLRLAILDWNALDVKVLHVVTAIGSVEHATLAGRAERLNSKQLTFLHLSRGSAFDNRNGLARMNLVRSNGMAAQVLDCLDSVRLVADRDFMRLHYFLNSTTDVAQAHVNTRLLDTLVGGFFHREQQWIEHRIERHRECTINDVAVDLSSVVDLHDVVGAEHRVVSWVRRVMRSAIVDAAAGRERDTCLQTVLLAKTQISFLDLLADVDKLHAGSHERLRVFTNLPVAFSGLAQIVHLGLMQSISGADFSVRRALRVEVARVVHPFTLREHAILELLRHRNRIVNSLLPCAFGAPVAEHAQLRVILFAWPRCVLWLLLYKFGKRHEIESKMSKNQNQCSLTSWPSLALLLFAIAVLVSFSVIIVTVNFLRLLGLLRGITAELSSAFLGGLSFSRFLLRLLLVLWYLALFQLLASFNGLLSGGSRSSGLSCLAFSRLFVLVLFAHYVVLL